MNTLTFINYLKAVKQLFFCIDTQKKKSKTINKIEVSETCIGKTN